MGSKHVWNQQYIPYDCSYLKKTYRYIEEETNRIYAVGDLTGPGGALKKNAYYRFLGVERFWRYSKTRMEELLVSGRISHKSGRVPLLKRYLDEMHGKPVQDMWADIKPVLNSFKGTRYPTQKPEELLSRIVNTSTNSGQLVYDPFAGLATSGAVCFKLSRRWAGSEISENTCNMAINRLAALGCKANFYSRARLEGEQPVCHSVHSQDAMKGC
jgi:hypothetical protein